MNATSANGTFRTCFNTPTTSVNRGQSGPRARVRRGLSLTFLKCCEGATRLAIDEEAEVWTASSLGPRLTSRHQPRGCDLHGHVARGPAWARP